MTRSGVPLCDRGPNGRDHAVSIGSSRRTQLPAEEAPLTGTRHRRSWALLVHATQVLGESSALLMSLPYAAVDEFEEATSEERLRTMHVLDSSRGRVHVAAAAVPRVRSAAARATVPGQHITSGRGARTEDTAATS